MAPDTILFVASLDNVRFRNLELDGKDLADVGVRASGIGSGVTFENVTVRGIKKAGFLLQSISADKDRPFTLERCRVLLSPGREGGLESAVRWTRDESSFVTVALKDRGVPASVSMGR